jgi:hypothetical protein
MPRAASKAVNCVCGFAPGHPSRVRTQEYLADIIDFHTQGIIILRGVLAQAALDELAAKRRADEASEESKKEAERLLREQAAAQRRVEAAAASMADE